MLQKQYFWLSLTLYPCSHTFAVLCMKADYLYRGSLLAHKYSKPFNKTKITSHVFKSAVLGFFRLFLWFIQKRGTCHTSAAHKQIVFKNEFWYQELFVQLLALNIQWEQPSIQEIKTDIKILDRTAHRSSIHCAAIYCHLDVQRPV